VAVHKALTGCTPATFAVTNFSVAAAAQVWQLTASNSVVRRADAVVTNGALAALLPAQSVTLFVLPRQSPPPPRLGAIALLAGGGVGMGVSVPQAERYVIEASTDLTGWVCIETNFLSGGWVWLRVPDPGWRQGFYRAVWRAP
jgi:hypothetical protein